MNTNDVSYLNWWNNDANTTTTLRHQLRHVVILDLQIPNPVTTSKKNICFSSTCSPRLLSRHDRRNAKAARIKSSSPEFEKQKFVTHSFISALRPQGNIRNIEKCLLKSIAPSCKSDNTKSISARATRVKAELFEALQKQSNKSKRNGENEKNKDVKR